jgi:hypothetical protein
VTHTPEGGLEALRRRVEEINALPSISLSFSLATILPPEPNDIDFSLGAVPRWTACKYNFVWLEIKEYEAFLSSWS